MKYCRVKYLSAYGRSSLNERTGVESQPAVFAPPSTQYLISAEFQLAENCSLPCVSRGGLGWGKAIWRRVVIVQQARTTPPRPSPTYAGEGEHLVQLRLDANRVLRREVAKSGRWDFSKARACARFRGSPPACLSRTRPVVRRQIHRLPRNPPPHWSAGTAHRC
jgi:hypothetical protein